MNKPFNWKDVDRNKFVHPIDEDDVIGGPKHTNVWYPTEEDLKEKAKTGHSSRLTRKQKAHMDRIHANARKPVIQKTLDGRILRRFLSAREAADFLGVSLKGIRSACNGQRPTCEGYKWEYAND